MFSSILCNVNGAAYIENNKYPNFQARLVAHTANNNATHYNVVTDNAITGAVKLKIAKDTEASVFDIKVTTKDGEVILKGFVPDEKTKNNVVALTQSVADVRKIDVSGLEINPDQSHKASKPKNVIADSVITADLKKQLLNDDEIKSLTVHVETINGVVILSGTVASEKGNNSIKHVEAVARNTKGVRDVINQIEIR